MYGHLQKGEYELARSLLEKMQTFCYEKVSSRSVAHLVMMKAAYFTETGNWDDELLNDTLDYSEEAIQTYAAHCFTKGMAAFKKSNSDDLKTTIQDLTVAINEVTNDVLIGNPEMCSGSYSRGRPTQLHVDRAKVMNLELMALLSMIQNNDIETESLLQEAVELEEQTSYNYGPPEIVKPSHEMYAEWLIGQKRFEEAADQYEKVLHRAPKRFVVLAGLEKIRNLTKQT